LYGTGTGRFHEHYHLFLVDPEVLPWGTLGNYEGFFFVAPTLFDVHFGGFTGYGYMRARLRNGFTISVESEKYQRRPNGDQVSA
jgi:hypothetical protein